MVTTMPPAVARVTSLVRVYVLVVGTTIGALVVLSAVAPDQATDDAWGHALMVGAFAIVLQLRLRPARRGDLRALRPVAVIAAVLLVVNLAEAAVPGLFPVWMRVEMVGIALLMGAIVLAVRRR